MSEGQIEGNSATAVAEPAPSGQAAPVTTETPSQSGQAATQAQSAPVEEQFSSIDPKSLPPELQAVYKSMQADYTKKLQPIADIRKKAEGYDKIVSRPDFKDYWNGLNRQEKAEYKEQKAEAEKTLGQKITDERFQKSLETKDGFLELIAEVAREMSGESQKKLAQLEEKLSVKEAQDVIQSFATEIGPDGKPLRPDYDSLDEDQLITGYLNVNPPEDKTSQAYIKRLHEAYGWAKQVSQKYYEKGKSEALQIIQKKAASSSEPPTTSAKGAYTGPNPKNLSTAQAIELAKKGIRVPRED